MTHTQAILVGVLVGVIVLAVLIRVGVIRPPAGGWRSLHPERISLAVNLPGLSLSGDWTPNKAEKDVAYEILVQLTTRTCVAEVPEGGELRGVLTSLYAVVGETRAVLKEYGVAAAQPRPDTMPNAPTLAIAMVALFFRPFLGRWHPALEAHELRRPHDVPKVEWEARWEREPQLRKELAEFQQSLRQYVVLLAKIAGTNTLLPLDGDVWGAVPTPTVRNPAL